MESMDTVVTTLALAMGASWASGINLYAAVAVLGIGSATGSIELPAEMEILENPLVFGAAGLMYFVEFFADKIPGLDSAWDAIHTFIRIPAGAMLAVGAVGDVAPAWEIAAGLMGGSLSASSHVAKASTRAAINMSPEPFSNWTASVGEDVAVFGGMYAIFAHPWLLVSGVVVFVIAVAVLLPFLWRGLKAVFAAIGRLFGVRSAPAGAESSGPAERPPLQNTVISPGASTDGASGSAADESTLGANRIDQLERLQRLRDSGALSDAEFEAEKQRLPG